MGAGADAHADDATDEYGIPIIPDPADAASRKRRAIIDAALAEFLAEGYSAASMDAITRSSGVSKATIYKHFGSKERLFLAVIGGVLPQTYAGLEPSHAALADAPDLRAALVRLTTDWARILLRPDIMKLRRLVIGEIDRFPQLGRLWYRVSYEMTNGPLIEAFTALDARGTLDVPDPALAVQQLVGATVGVPQLVRTFSPDAELDDAELTRVIGAGVDLFLAGYARP
ncbi:MULTISPECIES: TetR/AcrR family transcriptional regulator [unclassified Streptomyces]|uniref:TetR/AcrR family transcriptional regulator n=1 Tax=unclassified Streptomyces TaxID=2593676 RepID=UPI0006F3E4B5|nr:MULTISPECIES: TetR/AcrR family transcriptional regulator [unclassified Streptomyces]KQX59413.1 TetR family transcriptional regulator [Streptomyces sp. Root1304]KRB00673.1 TetR family transcriptional regulator [Streptomyces sp. Root66D1]